MLTVWAVCKSGAEYDAEWVRKLKAGVTRNLTVPHEFKCLSDIDVPGRVPLRHKWPGWWSKLEVFREAKGPSLYLDLDTVVTGNIDHLTDLPMDFAAIQNFHDENMIGSAVMWFKKPMVEVYEKFCEKPFRWIEYHDRKRDGPYLGDQAFIWDSMGRKVETFDMEKMGIKSFKFHCREGLPKDTRVVCFGGKPKATEVKANWLSEHWK
jgi:hypothetical protein